MALLKGKVAFVSGGGSGIGRAVAETYAKEGAKVVIADINEQHGAETVKAITDAGGEAFFIKGDSSKAEDNKRFVAETVSKYGRLDIACNNAGIGGPALPTPRPRGGCRGGVGVAGRKPVQCGALHGRRTRAGAAPGGWWRTRLDRDPVALGAVGF